MNQQSCHLILSSLLETVSAYFKHKRLEVSEWCFPDRRNTMPLNPTFSFRGIVKRSTQRCEEIYTSCLPHRYKLARAAGRAMLFRVYRNSKLEMVKLRTKPSMSLNVFFITQQSIRLVRMLSERGELRFERCKKRRERRPESLYSWDVGTPTRLSKQYESGSEYF
jgi:hypothetical protein